MAPCCFKWVKTRKGRNKYGTQEIRNKKRDKIVVSNLNADPREVLCILTSTVFLSEGVM
jgi:hypothetical protein